MTAAVLPVAVPEVFPAGDYAASRLFGLDLVFEETPGAGTYTVAVDASPGTLILTALLFVDALWDASPAVFSFGSVEEPGLWFPALDVSSATASIGTRPQLLLGGWRVAAETTVQGQVVAGGAGGSSGLCRLRLVYLPPANPASELQAVKT